MTIIKALTTLEVLGYIGDIAFVIVGIIAAKKIGLRPFTQFLSGMSTAFFGGIFLRDLGLVSMATQSLTMPSIFGSPLEIAATAAVGLIVVALLKRSRSNGKLAKPLNTVLCMADSIGIAGFAAFGYGRGIQAGAPWWIALACAFATACGGGIIAAGIRAAGAKDWRYFFKTLAGNKFYFILCFLASAVSCLWYSPIGYSDGLLIALSVFTVISGFIVEGEKSARGRRGTRRPPQSKSKSNKK